MLVELTENSERYHYRIVKQFCKEATVILDHNT